MAEIAREGFSFVFAKVSEGSGFRDWTWPHYRDAAKAAGLRVAGYHYLTTDDVNAQADLFLDQLGDPGNTVGIMIDFEANSGGIGNFWAFVRALNARGRQVNISYIPHWYWQQIGSPDISKAPGLDQSSYVNGSGAASALYPGDNSGFWTGFGGGNVSILQFSDKATIAGNALDVNAFEGSLDDLDALLGIYQGGIVGQTEVDQVTHNVIGWLEGYLPNFYATAAATLKELTGSPFVGKFPGFPELGNRTEVQALQAIGFRLGIAGFTDPATNTPSHPIAAAAPTAAPQTGVQA